VTQYFVVATITGMMAINVFIPFAIHLSSSTRMIIMMIMMQHYCCCWMMLMGGKFGWFVSTLIIDYNPHTIDSIFVAEFSGHL